MIRFAGKGDAEIKGKPRASGDDPGPVHAQAVRGG